MPTHIVGPKSLAWRLGNPKPTPIPLKDSIHSPICLNKPGTYLNILGQLPEDYR